MVDSLASLCAIALVLSVVDGKPTTTSLDIARHFKRPHDEVLRRIRNLLSQLEGEPLRNFAEGSYTLPATGGQQHPMYRITRDGFTLLAMGFTGKKALQFKLAYIDAFNKMEAQIAGLGNSANPAQLADLTPGGKPCIASAPTPQRWLMELDAQGRPQVKALSAGAHMLRAADIGKLLLQKDSPFSNAEVMQIADHANTRMFIDVANLQSASELEQLRKTVRTLCVSDLTEIAKQAWLELSLRTKQGATA